MRLQGVGSASSTRSAPARSAGRGPSLRFADDPAARRSPTSERRLPRTLAARRGPLAASRRAPGAPRGGEWDPPPQATVRRGSGAVPEAAPRAASP